MLWISATNIKLRWRFQSTFASVCNARLAGGFHWMPTRKIHNFLDDLYKFCCHVNEFFTLCLRISYGVKSNLSIKTSIINWLVEWNSIHFREIKSCVFQFNSNCSVHNLKSANLVLTYCSTLEKSTKFGVHYRSVIMYYLCFWNYYFVHSRVSLMWPNLPINKTRA